MVPTKQNLYLIYVLGICGAVARKLSLLPLGFGSIIPAVAACVHSIETAPTSGRASLSNDPETAAIAHSLSRSSGPHTEVRIAGW